MATIKVSFEINDVLVNATCEASGHYRHATFHNEAEDEREVNAEKIELFDVDGNTDEGTSNFLNKIHKHIDDNFLKIYQAAEKNQDSITLSNITV